MPGRTSIEWYQNTSSKPWGAIAMLTGLGITVLGIVEGPSWIAAAGGLLLAALSYASIWRPAVGVDETTLRLRGMYSTTLIPLAAVDSIVITRTLAITVIGKRYISSAINQSLRRAVLGPNAGRGMLGAVKADSKPTYAELIDTELNRRVRDARIHQRVAQGSDEQAALAGQVHREVAWVEVAISAVLAVAFVVSILL